MVSETSSNEYRNSCFYHLDTRNNRDFGGAIIQFVGAG